MAEQKNGSDQVGGRKVDVKTCDPCRNKDLTTDAVLYCKNCEEFQCEECSKGHEIFKIMKGHELIDVTQAEPKIALKTPSFDMKGLDICMEHNEEFKFFCVDEDKLSCSFCLLNCHKRGCKNVSKLPEEDKKVEAELAVVQTDVLKLEKSANTLARFLQETRDAVGSELEPLLDQLEEMKQSVVKKFDDIKTKVTETIQEKTKPKTAELEEKLAESKSVIQAMEESKSILVSVLENGNAKQKFIAKYTIEKKNDIHQMTANKHLSSICRPRFFFKSNMQSRILEYVDSMTLLHSDTVHVVTGLPGQTGQNLPVDATSLLHSDIIHADTATPVKLELVTSVDVKPGEVEEEEPLYTGMDFLSDGRLVVVDNLNKKLHVMNERLEELGMYQFSNYSSAVAVVSKEEVAVTSGGVMVIEFLHVSNTNTITLTRTITTTAWYDSICLMNETTFLVSTFADKRPLRMITLTGEEKDFGNLPKKQYGIDDIWSTYIRNRDILVLTDRRDNTVYMYDNKKGGALICAVKDESIKEPRGVCVGPDDSLFVSCKVTNSIVHVSPSGRVLGSHKLEMKYPYTVCMSKDGKTVAVSSNVIDDRKFQLYLISDTCT